MTGLTISLDGTTDLPAGKIATVVTFLEIGAPPAKEPPTDGLTITHLPVPAVDRYRALYRQIGEDWLWFSRAAMDDDALSAVIGAPTSDILVLGRDGADIGLAELDFSDAGNAEIVSFGVVGEATGTGAARQLMLGALAHAFTARPGIGRVWLHTCTADHPGAVRFYRKMGFKPYRIAIEVVDDPRLNGTLRADAAPHIAIIPSR